jgi:hypothetical protein
MSEYGEIETSEGQGGLSEAHVEHDGEQDYQSQYGILEQSHESFEHEEFENVKHIEYTDAQGNHYEVTEFTHYEHTEIEQDHAFVGYGEESGDAGLGDAGLGGAELEGTESFSEIDSITSRFENFFGNVLGDNGPYEISDSSA